jgi:REP element-mobilizing transposase RayT
MVVIAYHIVMAFYGFWLPNDERGSGSRYVGSKNLYPFGEATYIKSQRSVARRRFDKALQLKAKQRLKYKPVILNGPQARAVARGFAEYVAKSRLVVYACAILPDHVHLVVERFRYPIEQVMTKLKSAATQQLLVEGLHPFQSIVLPEGGHPNIFSRDGRHVFLFTDKDVIRRIDYVNDNPINAGLAKQHWNMIVPFTGFPNRE